MQLPLPLQVDETTDRRSDEQVAVAHASPLWV
jgi:hypothetical protein